MHSIQNGDKVELLILIDVSDLRGIIDDVMGTCALRSGGNARLFGISVGAVVCVVDDPRDRMLVE